MKKCSNKDCNNPFKDSNGYLPLTEFFKFKYSKDKLTSRCCYCLSTNKQAYGSRKFKRSGFTGKDAQKNSDLKYNYGITLQEYNDLLQSQDGKCGICSKFPSNKRLAVDHNHITGEVRGLLCDNCNRGIGMFDVDTTPASIINILKYLKVNVNVH